MPTFLAAIAAAAVLVQGGYFPAFFLWAGAALGGGVLFCGKRLALSWELLPLAALALWYLLASLANGVSVASLSQAVLPLVCLLFFLLARSMSGENRRLLLVYLCRFAGPVAIAAILAFFGILPIDGAVTAQRLQFTFQYVNAAGVWFAAVALLRGEVKDKWVNRFYPFVLVALLLTRSIGAIGLFVVLQLYVTLSAHGARRSWKVYLPLGAVTLCGGGAVLSRLGQGIGTFQERLVQSWDGLRAMLAAPIFGYGAGAWETVKPLFQSYDYRATVVHNSYIQAGVSAGFPAPLLLVAALVLALRHLKGRSPALKAAALIIPLHGVMDFSLSFLSIDCLLLSILALPAPAGTVVLPRWGSAALGGICLVGFLALAILRVAG